MLGLIVGVLVVAALYCLVMVVVECVRYRGLPPGG